MCLVDRSESSGRKQDHWPGARLLPRGVLEAAAGTSYPRQVPELATARDRQVVLNCTTGVRAAMFAAVWQMRRLQNVLNLASCFTE